MQPSRMRRNLKFIACAQFALVGAAATMGFMVHAGWHVTVGLALLTASLLTLSAAPNDRWQRIATTIAWTSSCLFLSGLPLGPQQIHALDIYHAVMVWLVTAAIAPSARRVTNSTLKKWVKILALAGALVGTLVWLAAAYLPNESGTFHVGLGIALVLLVLWKRWFQLSSPGVQAVNTIILFIVTLPMVDLITRPTSRRDGRLALANRYYNYTVAKKNPAAFRNWWDNYLDQWSLMGGDVFTGDPFGVLPFRLKPNSQGFLFDSRIQINSKGFRGKEFPDEKGNFYRIVALGESTTFGCTLNATDRPWPEELEQMIRERLKLRRPVQVINAGVPAYSLQHNLHRLATDILPLKPDMIISYHGANGFHLLDEALPKPFGELPPAYKRRPVKLLADCEYRLKMLKFRRHLNPQRLLEPTGFSNPLVTQYAAAYSQLIEIAGTNHIRLILANYAMAVNNHSDPDAVEFYRTCSPSIHWQLRGNVVHSELVKQLAQLHPEIRFVDTHPNLDGDPEKFIDLVHFTQTGRQQIAENIFLGIRSIMEEALAESVPYPAR